MNLTIDGNGTNQTSVDERAEQLGTINSHTVIVILEAKVGKETELGNALRKVAQFSREEDSCIQYHLYQDPDNSTQFALYEQWKSKELHQQQFEKSYIVDFVSEAESLLAQPSHAFFGRSFS